MQILYKMKPVHNYRMWICVYMNFVTKYIILNVKNKQSKHVYSRVMVLVHRNWKLITK